MPVVASRRFRSAAAPTSIGGIPIKNKKNDQVVAVLQCINKGGNVPFDEYFTGANGVLKDGHGLSIECRWNGAAAAQSGEGASGRGMPAAKTAARACTR